MQNIYSGGSSSHASYERSPTPPRIERTFKKNGHYKFTQADEKLNQNYVFPVYMPKSHSKLETGLRSYQRTEFAYLKDLTDWNDVRKGINQPNFVTVGDTQYVYKPTYVKKEYLENPNNINIYSVKLDPRYFSQVYHSHSRAMMQIMMRNLCALILQNKNDVIFPEIYPVVDDENDQVCGIITEKIDFQEAKDRDNYHIFTACGLEEEDVVNKEIQDMLVDNKIPFLMKILGINDINNKYEGSNIGLTEDKKLVFFDFGDNLLDHENKLRTVSPSPFLNLYRHEYLRDALTEDSKTLYSYLEYYGTENDENGLAKTIDQDILNIVMDWGPGDKDYRNYMAHIIQSRINEALEFIK